MLNCLKKIFLFVWQQKAMCIVFLVCTTYWTYLFFTTEMIVQFDALGYEKYGQALYEGGWEGFLKDGPHREPLYPLSVALSMQLADIFSISYQSVQKLLQIIVLFTTQLMFLMILNKLKIHNGIKWCVLLYIGCSPAIINSVFSLYSEIIVIPFVLALAYFGYSSWRHVHMSSIGKVFVWSVLTGLAFVGASFGKGIFQYIFLIYLIPFVSIGIYALIKRKNKILSNVLVYLICTAFILGTSVVGYRFLNKKYNGSFEFTSRYDGNLYGTATKRTSTIGPEIFMAHVASIPGGGVCRKFFSEQTCQYPEFYHSDHFRAQLPALLADTPPDEVHSKTISLAFERVAERPGQYFLLTALESLKMGFWESTQLGNVVYPLAVQKILKFSLVKNGIRILAALLTYISLFYLVWNVFINRHKLCDFGSEDFSRIHFAFFCLLIIVPFTGLYALFSILTRFALPISVLYLSCIAFTAQNLLFQKPG